MQGVKRRKTFNQLQEGVELAQVGLSCSTSLGLASLCENPLSVSPENAQPLQNPFENEGGGRSGVRLTIFTLKRCANSYLWQEFNNQIGIPMKMALLTIKAPNIV